MEVQRFGLSERKVLSDSTLACHFEIARSCCFVINLVFSFSVFSSLSICNSIKDAEKSRRRSIQCVVSEYSRYA